MLRTSATAATFAADLKGFERRPDALGLARENARHAAYDARFAAALAEMESLSPADRAAAIRCLEWQTEAPHRSGTPGYHSTTERLKALAPACIHLFGHDKEYMAERFAPRVAEAA